MISKIPIRYRRINVHSSFVLSLLLFYFFLFLFIVLIICKSENLFCLISRSVSDRLDIIIQIDVIKEEEEEEEGGEY